MAKSLARRPSQARAGASDLAIHVPQLIHELVQITLNYLGFNLSELTSL